MTIRNYILKIFCIKILLSTTIIERGNDIHSVNHALSMRIQELLKEKNMRQDIDPLYYIGIKRTRLKRAFSTLLYSASSKYRRINKTNNALSAKMCRRKSRSFYFSIEG